MSSKGVISTIQKELSVGHAANLEVTAHIEVIPEFNLISAILNMSYH